MDTKVKERLNEDLVRAICNDIEKRIAEGRPAQAIDRMKQSAIEFDDEFIMEVFYCEHHALVSSKLPTNTQSWFHAFPKLRDRMERIVRLNDIFGESETGVAHEEKHAVLSEVQSLPIPEDSSERIGHYVLLEEIGRGAFGTIYKAKQVGLDRIVAVKLITHCFGNAMERVRLQAEASSIAALHHPNIVQIFEFGTDRGCDYLSMEFVEGGNLEQQLKTSRSMNEIATLLSKLADAVQAAHDQGIIHRDLKPSNILVDRQGNPKIADFGLAKRYGDAIDLKSHGVLSGTPSHMAPEQLLGQIDRVGPRTDVFGLGVILYQLVYQRLPFLATKASELSHQILHQSPKYVRLDHQYVPRDLQKICAKCLAKNPEDRYESARAFQLDLIRFLEHRPIEARQLGLFERAYFVIKRNPMVSGLVAAMVLMVFTFATWLSQKQNQIASWEKKALQSQAAVNVDLARAEEANKAFEQSMIRAREMVERWTHVGEVLGDSPGMSNVSRVTLENAVAYYEEFLSRSSKDPQVRIEAAHASIRVSVLYSQLGLWRQAEEGLNNANQMLQGLPLGRDVQWEMTNCLMHQGILFERLERWEEAKAAYQSAIKKLKQLVVLHPEESLYGMRLASVWNRLSLVLYGEKMFDEALTMLSDAIELQVQCIEIRVNERKEVAANWTTPASTSEETIGSRIKSCGQLVQRIGPADAAAWKPLSVKNYLEELAMGLDGLGYVLQGAEKFGLAEDAYRKALLLRSITEAHCPTELWRHQLVARNQRHLGSLFFNMDRKQEALIFLDEAIVRMERLAKDFPDRIDYKIDWSETLCEASRVIRANENPKRAIEYVKKAIHIQEELVANNPGFINIKRSLGFSLATLALAYHSLELDPEAIECYERALKVDPTRTTAMNNFAWLLSTSQNVKLRDPGRAKALIWQALHVHPTSSAFWSTLAMASYRCGEYETADDALNKSMSFSDGNSLNDWFLKAMIEARLKRIESAERWLRDAQEREGKEKANEVILSKFAKEAACVVAECRQQARFD